MGRTTKTLTIAVAGLVLLCASADADPAVTVFDAPGARETMVNGFNDAGLIVGQARMRSTEACGLKKCAFIRAADGSFSFFAAPEGETNPYAMNATGTVVGWSGKGQFPVAFVRAPNGLMTSIALPGQDYSIARAINADGFVAGISNKRRKGVAFVRAPDGTIQTFKAGKMCINTEAAAINTAGTIAGTCSPRGFPAKNLGFLRSAAGAITMFDGPSNQSIDAYVLDDEGDVAGTVAGLTGYVRYNDGTIEEFNVPGGGQIAGIGSVRRIGDDVVVAGFYFESESLVGHGFIRHKNGDVETFDAGPADGQFNGVINTFGNASGVIAGTYNYHHRTHGFLRTP